MVITSDFAKNVLAYASAVVENDNNLENLEKKVKDERTKRIQNAEELEKLLTVQINAPEVITTNSGNVPVCSKQSIREMNLSMAGKKIVEKVFNKEPETQQEDCKEISYTGKETFKIKDGKPYILTEDCWIEMTAWRPEKAPYSMKVEDFKEAAGHNTIVIAIDNEWVFGDSAKEVCVAAIKVVAHKLKSDADYPKNKKPPTTLTDLYLKLHEERRRNASQEELDAIVEDLKNESPFKSGTEKGVRIVTWASCATSCLDSLTFYWI